VTDTGPWLVPGMHSIARWKVNCLIITQSSKDLFDVSAVLLQNAFETKSPFGDISSPQDFTRCLTSDHVINKHTVCCWSSTHSFYLSTLWFINQTATKFSNTSRLIPQQLLKSCQKSGPRHYLTRNNNCHEMFSHLTQNVSRVIATSDITIMFKILPLYMDTSPDLHLHSSTASSTTASCVPDQTSVRHCFGCSFKCFTN